MCLALLEIRIYNSVIATFSHQLTHNEIPKVEIDGTLKFIYIDELVTEIWKIIEEKQNYTSLPNKFHSRSQSFRNSLIT